jgi:ORF6N domain-containing protein
MPKKSESLVPIEQLDEMIHTIRGVRVMLDRDLAEIYGVPTFRFNEAIKRNRHRFPPDFMFQLTREEFASLRSEIAMSKPHDSSQFAMSSGKHRGAAYRPYAFTEHGALEKLEVRRMN